MQEGYWKKSDAPCNNNVNSLPDLGFLYLIGKDKKLPNTLLEAYSFRYINFSAELLVEFFNHKELKFDNDEAKELWNKEF